MFHLALHFAAPALLAGLFYRKNWKLAYLLMIATMLVDVDHLFATPVYGPNRCSIGFHPLHELWFIVLYIALCFVPKMRLIGIGLSLHMPWILSIARPPMGCGSTESRGGSVQQ